MHIQPSPLEVHEEKVHNNVYASSRSEKTRYGPQSISAAVERGARNVMERRSQYVGRRGKRIFPNESRGDHDYLELGYFSGQVVQGFCACVRCMDNTTYRQLEKDPGSSKTMFQGSRRWLPKKHPWRKLGHLFDGSEELRAPPARRSGKEIDNLLKTWEGAPRREKNKIQPFMRVWKAKSV